MNSIKSFWYGWGALCVAGGGSYYFAKKSINADRKARYEADEARRIRAQAAVDQYAQSHSTSSSPSNEAGGDDPAPTRHAPVSDREKVVEKSKYEASEPYRSKKGDRFS